MAASAHRTLNTAPVRTPSLEPVQHSVSRAFRTQCDFWQQRLLKHPHRSEFHSRAEYLHAGLLEGNPTVTVFVPQPYRLQVGRRWYTPDCFVLETGRRRVLEIKPGAHMDEALRGPVTAFFARHGLDFEVVANEHVFERHQEAENWLEIVRRLVASRDRDTTVAEVQVWERCLRHPRGLTVGDVIDRADRESTFAQEIALYRLLHRGRLQCDLDWQPLGYDTEVEPCT